MNLLRPAWLMLGLTLGSLAAPAAAIVIDDFSVGPAVINGPSQLDQSGLDPAHVLGGTRRFDVGQFGLGSRIEIADGQLQLSSSGTGYFELIYGGVQPLDNVDLTEGGHDRLLIRFGEVGAGFRPFSVYVQLPSNSSDNGEGMYIQDSWDGILVEIPYSKFPVPFTAVQKITFAGYRNPSGSAFAIESIYTGGPSVAGDYNRDGIVDNADLAEWRISVGNTSTSGSFGASFTADGDQDGDVDGADFLVWQRSFGAGVTASNSNVPEPAASALLLGVCVGELASYAALLSTTNDKYPSK